MANDLQLVVVNTAHIQQYIFGSNRLRENIGASYLVDAVTGEQAWRAVFFAVNQPDQSIPAPLDQQIPIESGAPAEVIYAAGGNFVVLFRDVAQVKMFGRTLSVWAHEHAPGLRLLIHSQDYTWGEPLGAAIGAALGELRKARSTQPGDVPTAGLGVTMMCRSTALPASTLARLSDRDTEPLIPISAEVAAKWDAAAWANERLSGQFLNDDSPYVFPSDFDELGRTRGDSSFIAVVHADGNGMGSKVRKISEEYSDPRGYITEMRRFSENVAQAATEALRDSLALLLDHIIIRDENTADETRYIWSKANDHEIELIRDQHSGQWKLPFRPLVFGGDDVTFVCDGRLGIGLALAYLRAFKTRTAAPEHEVPSTAAAGIAIVKAHYPFARAYQLAESLTKSAKTLTRSGLALDWHFALSGLLTNLETIRARDYMVRDGSLTLRPLSIDGKGIHDWNMVEDGLNGFYSDRWAEKRNKLKALHDALSQGKAAVTTFLSTYRAHGQLPALPIKDFEINGWHRGHCGYTDALELLDLYIPLG